MFQSTLVIFESKQTVKLYFRLVFQSNGCDVERASTRLGCNLIGACVAQKRLGHGTQNGASFLMVVVSVRERGMSHDNSKSAFSVVQSQYRILMMSSREH